jgi:hypothetical protein
MSRLLAWLFRRDLDPLAQSTLRLLKDLLGAPPCRDTLATVEARNARRAA